MKKLALLSILIATVLLVAALPLPVLGHENQTGDSQGSPELGEHHQGQNHQTIVAFHIRLVGAQQVPPVTTQAFGRANVRLVSNGNALQFRVTVCNIVNVTMAHIHVQASGKNGPVILFLYHMHDPPFSSPHGCHVLSSGTLHPSPDLIPSAANGINNWTDFVNALLAGNTYVNVHTSANPGGEIRGQLVTHHSIDSENDD